jgi:RNA polymerase sigma factor (sigma-70 family)
MSDGSVSGWIGRLKSGEAEAAQRLWDRYARQMIDFARRKMGDMPKSIADEEDVAQNVFGSICRGAAAGRFTNVKNRDDLWWLLLAITRQKVVDQVRHATAQKRGMGRVRSESQLRGAADGDASFALDHLVGEVPTPEFLVMFEEETHRLLSKLRDDKLRRIAISRIEGYTVSEIAAELSVSTRAVERKLELIRATWASEMLDHG